jgi:hypothetical protein
MKKLITLMALVAFTFTASAHCGNCDTDGDNKDKKPAKKCCGKEEGKCCKKETPKDHNHDH